MVNVRTIAKFGALAVAMCMATAAADNTEARYLQAETEAPSPSPVESNPPSVPQPLPDAVTVAPATPDPASPQPDTPAPPPASVAPADEVTPAPMTVEPVPTTVEPVPTTVEPVPTTVEPVPTTVEPVPTTVEPVPTTVEPVPTTVEPVPTTVEPAPPVTTDPPVPPTDPPVPPTDTPVPPTDPPVPPTDPPVPPTDPPTPPTDPPVPPTDPPIPPTDTPVPPTDPPNPPTPDPITSYPPISSEPATSEPPVFTVIPVTPPPTDPASSGEVDKTDVPVTLFPDDGQANAPDVIVYNETAVTKKPTGNPFEIREVDTDAPRPVVLDIRDDDTPTETPKLYVRGDVETDAPSSGSGSETGNASPTPNVIGGRNRNSATDASAILSASSAAFHDFLRYASCAFAGISVALLLFFHYVSLDATLSWTSHLWSPNTWEFLLYVTYLQQMTSVAQLTLLKTPYYLWDYADSFAWTNFLIQRPVSSVSRRLETIVLGGVVAFADRIGIDETKVVFHAVVGFLVVFAVLLVLFFTIAVLAKRKAEQALDASNLHVSTQGVHQLRSASIRTLGLCVLIWFFALYPLSLFASFEISMQIQSKTAVASALVVSILALGFGCFGVLAWSGRVIMQKSKDELLQFENMATWGSLYAEFSYRSRMFFVLSALVQIVTGIIVGTMDADPTQLIIVMIIEVLYLVAVFVMNPFAEELVQRFTYALGALKVLNYGLSFAFLNSNGLSGTGRNSVADAFIGINTLIIIAWFIRQLIVFSTYIRAWSVRSSFMEEDRNGLEDPTLKYETRTATDSEVYASVTTARHGEGSLPSDDDYHNAPPLPPQQREVF